MKLNILLPWLCVLGLSAGLAAVVVSNQKKNSELAQLREENAQVQQLRADVEKFQTQTKEQADRIAELEKGTQELLRLRSEVGLLRTEKQQLSKQVQLAQTQAQRAQDQAAQATQTGTQQLQQLQSENQQLRTVAVVGQQVLQRNACVNNLRQLDAAKQQWALEFNKTADAVPTAQNLAPYLKDKTLPACPAGGAYTLNAVGVVPTCSIPGHALQ